MPPTACSSQTARPDPAVNVCDGLQPTLSVGVFVVPGARLALNGHTIRRAQCGMFGGRPDFTSTRGTVKLLGPGTVTSSHLTGNARIDLTTELRPRVRDTICSRSAALEETPPPGIYEPSGPPWGVCAAD